MDFLLGVLASIVAALLVSAGALFGPALLSKIKGGPNIGGKWNTFDVSNGGRRAGHAHITQLGGRVWMKVTRDRKRNGEDIDHPRQFRYRGRFASGNLTALFHDRTATYATGAITLHYDPGSHQLIGRTMYFEDGEVQAYVFCLRRAQ